MNLRNSKLISKLQIAENIHTPAETLKELANIDDKAVLAAIAKNPNASPALLVKLAGKYLPEISYNSALPLILLEDPTFIEKICYEYCSSRYAKDCSAQLSKYFMKLAISSPLTYVRCLIAENKNTPVLYLQQLAQYENEDVKISLAHNENTPVYILKKLSEDKHDSVRSSLAYNKNTPVYILEKLATDENEYVKRELARSLDIPLSILQKLSEDESGIVRSWVACNRNTPVYILEKLAKEKK